MLLVQRILRVFLSLLASTSLGFWGDPSFANDGLDLLVSSSCSHSSDQFNCVEFVDNYDGDTFKVNIPRVHPLLGRDILVRVLGVDSPEIKGDTACESRAAERAREFTRDFLKNGRSISLSHINRDKYFRVLADVEVDGKSLGRELVRRGLAVEYDGGTKAITNWCRVP